VLYYLSVLIYFEAVDNVGYKTSGKQLNVRFDMHPRDGLYQSKSKLAGHDESNPSTAGVTTQQSNFG
jgi:hypothetical protein